MRGLNYGVHTIITEWRTRLQNINHICCSPKYEPILHFLLIKCEYENSVGKKGKKSTYEQRQG